MTLKMQVNRDKVRIIEIQKSGESITTHRVLREGDDGEKLVKETAEDFPHAFVRLVTVELSMINTMPVHRE